MNIRYHPAFLAAFQIEEVLRNIFSFCAIKDLQSIRLVCKKWFRESLSFYRSRKVISLALEPPEELLRNNRNKEKWTLSWEKFNELLESDGDDFLQLWTTPYTNFKFYTVKDDELVHSARNLRRNYGRYYFKPFVIPCTTVDIFGATISTLHLDFSRHYKRQGQRSFDEVVVKLICVQVPNLKQLFIKEWPCDKNKINSYLTLFYPRPLQRNLKVLGVHGNIPFTWEEIFSVFPSLQKLRLVEMKNHEYTVPSLFHAIRSSRSNSGVNELLELDLTVNCDNYCSVWNQDPYLLCDPPIFKNFKLHLDGKYKSKIGPGGTILHWLLLNPQPVIKTLCISNLKAKARRVNPIFHFSRQTTLAFVEEFIALDKNHLTDFHFLSYLPFLRKLVIKDVSLDKWRRSQAASLLPSTDPEYKSCRDLVFCSPSCLLRGTMLPRLTEFHFEAELDARSWQSLSGVTPNLRSIASVFTDETIQIICCCFLSLQQLKILAGSALSDKFLIGGQVGALVQYYSIFPNLTETESTKGIFGWQLYPHRFPVFSNIGNLNDLRNFIFEGSINDYEGCPRHREDDYSQNNYYDNDDCDDDCRRSSTDLGDAFVHHGLLKLPWLHTVRIEPKSRISEEAEKALRNKILSVDIYRKPKPDNPCAECTKVERCGRCANQYFRDVWVFRAAGCESEDDDDDSDFDDSEPANFVNYDKEDQLNQKILRKQKKWARYNYGSVLIS